MNRDDIIRMAREAMGHTSIKPNDKVTFYVSYNNGIDADGFCDSVETFIERFANLVAAAERERIKWDSIHSCHPECDKPVCVAMRAAVAEEREACAKVLDEMAAKDKLTNYYVVAALMIRERGAP